MAAFAKAVIRYHVPLGAILAVGGPLSSVHDVSEFLTVVRPIGPCIAEATGR